MENEWIDIEGSSKEDAIERACNALNTTEKFLIAETIKSGRPFKIRARKRGENEDFAQKSAGSTQDVYEDDDEGKFEDDEAPQMSARGEVDEDEAGERRQFEEDDDYEPDPELASKAKEVLEKLVSYIDDEAKVETREDGLEIHLNVKGNGSGVLIGKHGQTLESLQHLVAKILGLDGRERKRLILDSDDYRSRRKDSLEALARKVASKAKRERRSISLEPMSALDRRILHLALADDPSVTTRSVGEGMGRKVVVVPKKGRSRNGNDRGASRGDGSRGNGSRGNGRRPDRGNGNRGRGPRRAGGRDDDEGALRRSGPPARQHDSFDVPADPNFKNLPEEPDAPIMEGRTVGATEKNGADES